MHFLIAALAAALPLAAHAKSPADPSEPGSAAPALRYESAFAGYRSLKDEKPAPWKHVNDAVKGAGGHAAHAPPKAEPPAQAPKEAPAPAKPAEHKH